MKKQYTKKQISEAIAYWEGELKKLDESADDSSKESRKEELDGFAEVVYSFIKKAVDNKMWKPEYEGEQPTRERIEASMPWGMITPQPTAEEKAYVMDIVYPKLRKNSVFAKMKKAMAGSGEA